MNRIVTVPDERLLQEAQPVNGTDTRQLCQEMVEIMRETDGVGLAAPQIGVPLRVIVVEVPEIEGHPLSNQLYQLVNPQITQHDHNKVAWVEGCLSIPGFAGRVERYEHVQVEAHTPAGHPLTIDAHGFPAAIFQHEIDHLDGVLYPMRAQEMFHAHA